MLALSAFWAVSLSREARAGRLSRWLLLGAAAAATLSLHVLVYRTGLLAFYAALFVSGLLLLFRRPVLALALLAVGIALATTAYVSLPSVQKRIGATLYDINEYNAGRDINQLSISRRLAALHNAQVLVAEHPWLGVAPADVRQAMDEQFSWQTYGLTQENRVMIHNQYVHYLVGAGVAGLLLWLWVLITPLVQPGLRQNPYVRAYLLIFAAAALADSLLEMQIGFNLFVFLYGFLVVAADRHRQPSV
nr:O-antigen ligase family protein [Hymenobacter sp. 15J16-1T3B]